MPPTETFPGHQLTCARIMWVEKRMNPNVPRRAMKKRNAASRPGSTISRWNSLPMVAIVESTVGKLSAPAVAG